ncbi:hypothetical protein [Streptomyces doebereineriae]
MATIGGNTMQRTRCTYVRDVTAAQLAADALGLPMGAVVHAAVADAG